MPFNPFILLITIPCSRCFSVRIMGNIYTQSPTGSFKVLHLPICFKQVEMCLDCRTTILNWIKRLDFSVGDFIKAAFPIHVRCSDCTQNLPVICTENFMVHLNYLFRSDCRNRTGKLSRRLLLQNDWREIK